MLLLFMLFFLDDYGAGVPWLLMSIMGLIQNTLHYRNPYMDLDVKVKNKSML